MANGPQRGRQKPIALVLLLLLALGTSPLMAQVEGEDGVPSAGVAGVDEDAAFAQDPATQSDPEGDGTETQGESLVPESTGQIQYTNQDGELVSDGADYESLKRQLKGGHLADDTMVRLESSNGVEDDWKPWADAMGALLSEEEIYSLHAEQQEWKREQERQQQEEEVAQRAQEEAEAEQAQDEEQPQGESSTEQAEPGLDDAPEMLLPEGWERMESDMWPGGYYYRHVESGTSMSGESSEQDLREHLAEVEQTQKAMRDDLDDGTDSSSDDEEAPLPDGWYAGTDPSDGSTWYHRVGGGVSQRERPTEPAAAHPDIEDPDCVDTHPEGTKGCEGARGCCPGGDGVVDTGACGGSDCSQPGVVPCEGNWMREMCRRTCGLCDGHRASSSSSGGEGAGDDTTGYDPKTDKDPYDVLGIDRSALAGEIRKAYRKLSLKWHPDRHVGKDDGKEATARFQEVASAYELIGSPDKRALFDDFGREGAQQGGFRTYSEYMEASGGKEASQDFYQGDRYVSRLSEDLWEQRVAGDMPWVVEFYAPWCSHCVTSASIFRQTAEVLDGVVEFGAVNCASEEGKPICERNNVHQFPTVLLFDAKHGAQATFHDEGHDTWLEQMPAWVKSKVFGWRQAFARANTTKLTTQNFEEAVLGSEGVWFVLWTNGGHADVNSREHTPNFLRFAADVAGLAHVGVADCVELAQAGDNLCQEQGVADEQDFPAFWVYQRGDKERKGTGQRLFSATEMEPHQFFPLAARLLKIVAPLPEPTNATNSTNETNATGDNALDTVKEEEEKYEQPEAPPQQDDYNDYEAPHPEWHQRHMMVDDGGNGGEFMLGGG